MRVDKSKIILVITIFVVIIGSMLPVMIAMIEDTIVDENISYKEVKTVQLFKDLSDIQKMYLLENGIMVAVSEERANLKRENMQEIVVNVLCDYYVEGYILSPVNDFSIIECNPVLYYSNEESNLSGIFWNIQMELWDETGQSIYLCLDDQTGKVLLISYECLEDVYDREDGYYMSERLYSIYQSYMDWYMINSDYIEGTETYKEKTHIHYNMGDVLYGEIGIDFIVTETGFKIGLD